MDKILYLDHVDQYNRLYGLETLHPLVSVINLNEATRAVGTIRFNYGVYALFLKLEKACDIKYGARNTITKKGPSSVSLRTNSRDDADSRAYTNRCLWHHLPSRPASRHVIE